MTTQKFSPGTGSKNIPASQIPTATTYPNAEALQNRMADRVVILDFDNMQDTSADEVYRFVAPGHGKIQAIEWVNGATALDGTHGLELSFQNTSNSNDVMAYVGFGSGTEASKATDTKTTVAANTSEIVAVTEDDGFNYGDVITCTADRDGTSVTGILRVHLQLDAVGRN